MRNLIDLSLWEANFHQKIKDRNSCFCILTPKYRRLTSELIYKISDINFIKDISYSFKIETQNLIDNHKINEEHLLFDINSYVFSLENDLVNITKCDFYKLKIYTFNEWFSTFNKLKVFIAIHGKSNLIYKDSAITS